MGFPPCDEISVIERYLRISAGDGLWLFQLPLGAIDHHSDGPEVYWLQCRSAISYTQVRMAKPRRGSSARGKNTRAGATHDLVSVSCPNCKCGVRAESSAATARCSECGFSFMLSRPQGSEFDIGADEQVIPQAITGPNTATTTARSFFSFTVETSECPVVTITEKGLLPKKLIFTINGDGTATISGKPKAKGVYRLTIKATFGTDK